MNVDPQTLLLLSQQLASLANSSLQAAKGSTLTGTDLPPGPFTGTFDREKGKFGFIRQDSGEEDMFVLPGACKAFGEAFPAKGTRVTYDCVPHLKSGKTKAENVQPEAGAISPQAIAPDVSCTHAGTFDRERGNYGFIKQDNGEDDMFVMPGACKACGERFPPKGTRVTYNVVADPRSGKVKGEDLQIEGGVLGGMSPSAMALVQSALAGVKKTGYQQVSAPVQQNPGQYATGKFDRERTSFGFIKQDSGQDDMFVLPGCCEAFGGVFPPIGTHVMYSINHDTRNGKPIAENVQPQSGAVGAMSLIQAANQAAYNFNAAPLSTSASASADGPVFSGKFDRERGSFGFIKQDNGQDDMFVLPGCCEAFGGVFPTIGTQLTYTVNYDTRNGKPIAENVSPQSEAPGLAIASRSRGPRSRISPYA